ncbi:MAG: DNA-binding protein [Crocinitomicaceae bacterium]|nr:DNA-binding protein [Crocinitomicaceae bacterium]
MKNEIILYRPNEAAEHIEVQIDNETVWLNQEQISLLFQRDQSVISRHIRNVFWEKELDEKSNMQKMHIPNSDKLVTFYNLDVIISVGYRVKSKQGTQFRIWATTILREYLLKGFAINQRVDRIENNLENLSKEVSKISLQLKTNNLPNQGIFFDGQIYDAYELMSKIIRSAKKEIILIDNYVDEITLLMLSKRNPNCKAVIYTQKINAQLQLDLDKHIEQYPRIQVKQLKTSHDRFLIIDQKELYHIGASLKGLGKKWFAFSKLNAFLPELLGKIEN